MDPIDLDKLAQLVDSLAFYRLGSIELVLPWWVANYFTDPGLVNMARYHAFND